MIKRKTVDTITASLDRMVSQLQEHAETTRARAVKLRAKAAAVRNRALLADEEANHAKAVADRITGLIA